MGTIDKLTNLQNRRAAICAGGGAEKIKKQHDSGKKNGTRANCHAFRRGKLR